jgi:hypothetical protein
MRLPTISAGWALSATIGVFGIMSDKDIDGDRAADPACRSLGSCDASVRARFRRRCAQTAAARRQGRARCVREYADPAAAYRAAREEAAEADRISFLARFSPSPRYWRRRSEPVRPGNLHDESPPPTSA